MMHCRHCSGVVPLNMFHAWISCFALQLDHGSFPRNPPAAGKNNSKVSCRRRDAHQRPSSPRAEHRTTHLARPILTSCAPHISRRTHQATAHKVSTEYQTCANATEGGYDAANARNAFFGAKCEKTEKNTIAHTDESVRRGPNQPRCRWPGVPSPNEKVCKRTLATIKRV